MQPLIFILLFGLVQGILILVFFLHKKLYQGAYVFLLLYLGAMLLQLTLKVMNKIWLMENWDILYMFSHWLPLLYGPLIFLFVKHLLRPSSFSMKETFHFFLPAAVMVTIIIAKADLLSYNISVVFFNPHFRFALLAASAVAYHVTAFLLLKNQGLAAKNYFSGYAAGQLQWANQFVKVSFAASLLIISALYILYMVYPRWHEFRYLFVSLSICIYWFSYTALTNPVAFSVVKGYRKDIPEKELMIPPLKVFRPNKKYANSTLVKENALMLAASLQQLMKEKKLFLQPELNISQLSDELRCSRHHLSQVLNDQLGQSFYDYVNNLRIEEAKILLTNPQFSNRKIASIAYDAGFNSLSVFNDVFKKLSGKTPSEFRKVKEKESQQQRV